MTLIETDPPLAEPVTLAELKAHLRIDATDEDELLEGLIRVARVHLERLTGTALMTQGFRLLLDDWPKGDVIQLMKTPVQSMDAILVYDADGVAQGWISQRRWWSYRLLCPRSAFRHRGWEVPPGALRGPKPEGDRHHHACRWNGADRI